MRAYILSLEEARKMVPDNIQIKEYLESGSQKAVFKANYNGNNVALKIYNPECSIYRAQREINAMTIINSPYVVKLYEFNIQVSNNMTAMYSIEEFIEGESLSSYIANRKTLTEKELIIFLEKLLIAFIELRRCKLVHRDIKPSNIMFRRDNTPVLIDLGIARHLDLTSLTGTVFDIGPCTYPYASPEQLRNQKNLIGPRCDLYALGLVAYESYTGVHPYWDNDDSLENNINRMLTAPVPEVANMSESLSRFIYRLMQRDLYKRFRTPEQALEVLQGIMGG